MFLIANLEFFRVIKQIFCHLLVNFVTSHSAAENIRQGKSAHFSRGKSAHRFLICLYEQRHTNVIAISFFCFILIVFVFNEIRLEQEARDAKTRATEERKAAAAEKKAAAAAKKDAKALKKAIEAARNAMKGPQVPKRINKRRQLCTQLC